MSGNNTALVQALSQVLNGYSAENGSDTPDFILAEFAAAVIDSYDRAVREREKWHASDKGIPSKAQITRMMTLALRWRQDESLELMDDYIQEHWYDK